MWAEPFSSKNILKHVLIKMKQNVIFKKKRNEEVFSHSDNLEAVT